MSVVFCLSTASSIALNGNNPDPPTACAFACPAVLRDVADNKIIADLIKLLIS